MSHTIVLAQFTSKPNSRQYSDFETLEKALDGVCQLYEARLKAEQPNKKKITYDISDLFTFIDQLPDLCALVFDSNLSAYIPHNKQWIKDSVFAHLREQAAAAQQ